MKIQFPTPVLRAFRRRLTNLSSRNRSLLLTSLPAGQFLDLHDVDFLLNKSSFTIIAELISRKSAISLCEVLDPRQERTNEFSRKIRRIDRTTRFIQEERGTEDLYVGWPFVRGKFMDGTVVHGPLLFFPVKIEQQGKFWKLLRRGDELAFLNPTLALAYGQFSQVRLPDDVVEKTVDDFDRDPLVFRTQLYEWLKVSPLELNFNPDLFTDTLHFFDGQSAKSLDQLERTGELKLYPEAVLGIFPQAGSFLVPDYDVLLERNGARDDEREPLSGDTGLPDVSFTSLDGSLFHQPEKQLHTPLPLDASQEAAIRAVKAGQSIVVQGPPGTGKSQLIANLMADAAASGKRVLLVCQKRAALDVVQERLRGIGMAPFMALVHDFQDDRRALYAQIAEQINQVDTYRQQNNSLNAVLLERDFESESRLIDEAVADLTAFKKALFDTTDCGVSAKELYLTSNAAEQLISLQDNYSHFHFSSVDNFVRRLADYGAYQQRLGSNHVWTDRIRFANFTTADESLIDQHLAQWADTTSAAAEQLKALLGHVLSAQELTDWLTHEWAITALLALLDAPDAATLWSIVEGLRAYPAHPAMAMDESALDELALAWDHLLQPPGPELVLQPIERPAFTLLLDSALTARSSWVSWQWWQLTDPGKAQLQRVAAANGLSLSEPDLQILRIKVNNRLKLDALLEQAEPLRAGLALPATADGIRLLNRARQFTERLKSLPILRHLSESSTIPHRVFCERIRAVLALARHVNTIRTIGSPYLTGKQLDAIWQNPAHADTLRHALRQDFDLLLDADRLQASFSEGEQTAVDRLVTAEVKPADWPAAFQNALRLAWLDHIERAHPQLRSVSSLRMAQLEQSLQESVRHKQDLSRDIVLVKLREQTYRNLTFNRLSNVVTYRDLLHQTTKKRNVWPIRKLMDSYTSEIFKVIPCWMASPESVSAMFPLRENLFDLVIMDEASQCYAENGIPALARGRRVVVTGDNQQLRPSDLYRIRLDELDQTDETPVALEVESLLELAAQQLPQVSLKEHYRSRSLDLIAFSNEHFYQRKLLLLPHFSDMNLHEPAIRYLNVKGTWQQNTNPVEADAVVNLLNQLIHEHSNRSIGIVTFNYPQQQLIQDKLESSVNLLSAVNASLPDQLSTLQLFVKNIENVQGDERDIIIFSTGYAPDEHGRLAMQFGSLTMKGGQNRLNVAITRARERVYVITSLWPDQLRTDDSLNEGPRLLKAYLHYALDVSKGRFRPTPQPADLLPSRSLLKEQLAEQHPSWQPELPFADLTIKEAGIYQSLVLTDDDTYYQQSVKQAHAYLPLSFASRQWPFQRIWSREFWRGRS